jgi:hypothetical protein
VKATEAARLRERAAHRKAVQRQRQRQQLGASTITVCLLPPAAIALETLRATGLTIDQAVNAALSIAAVELAATPVAAPSRVDPESK